MRAFAGVAAATTVLWPTIQMARLLPRGAYDEVPRLYHRALLTSLGVDVEVEGEPAEGPALFVANHISWLDIPLLGSRLTASFVAKREVADMGIVGHLADLQRTLYVEREARRAAAAQAGEIERRLADGGRLILFPEGTSSDGARVLPFKTSLFAGVAGLKGVSVQPVALAYTALNGLPLARHRRAEVAWIGDMALAPHVLQLLRMGRLGARVLFLPPLAADDFADRKALAARAEADVRRGHALLAAGAGRAAPVEER